MWPFNFKFFYELTTLKFVSKKVTLKFVSKNVLVLNIFCLQIQSTLLVYFIWLQILFYFLLIRCDLPHWVLSILGGFRLHHIWIWVDSSHQIRGTFKADKDFGMLITWKKKMLKKHLKSLESMQNGRGMVLAFDLICFVVCELNLLIKSYFCPFNL